MKLTREELIRKIKNASPESDKDFREIIVSFIDLLSLRDEHVARMFSVTRPTVVRWRDGRSAPHPFMRPPMYKDLIQHLHKAT